MSSRATSQDARHPRTHAWEEALAIPHDAEYQAGLKQSSHKLLRLLWQHHPREIKSKPRWWRFPHPRSFSDE
jgi:hypothetical protein